MSNRDALRHLDSEGVADLPASPANPLRTLIYKLAESAILSYDEAIRNTPISGYCDDGEVSDDDLSAWQGDCRAKALRELDEALPTYGAVAAYPELIAGSAAVVEWLRGNHEFIRLHSICARLKDALVLSEKSLVIDEPDGPRAHAETEEDLPW